MTNRAAKRIALIIPWVGRRPWYWDIWQRSAEGRPFDIIVVERPLAEFSALAKEKLGRALNHEVDVNLQSGYKLCDLKPMLGVLFDDLLADCDYWAFGDCDVLYGRQFDGWIEKAVAGDFDVASVQSEFCSGPFTLVRNCERLNTLFTQANDWREMLKNPRTQSFDELGDNWFRRHIFGGESYETLRSPMKTFSSVVWREAAAGRLKLLAETVIREDLLSARTCRFGADGALMLGEEEVPLYHFIAEKNHFGFTRAGMGVRVSHGGAFARDAMRFGWKLLCGDRPSWYRVDELLQRKLGRRDWQRQLPWNNRIKIES